MRSVKFKIRQFTMFVASGNARCFEQSTASCLQAAITTAHSSVTGRRRLPSRAITNRTNFRCNFHRFGLRPLFIESAPRALFPASANYGPDCADAVNIPLPLWTTEEISCNDLNGQAEPLP